MKLATDRIDFFHDSNSGEKSLQWDAIVGRWDGPHAEFGWRRQRGCGASSVVAAIAAGVNEECGRQK